VPKKKKRGKIKLFAQKLSSNLHFCFPFSHIFASLEFREERKVLLEVIGPELQSIYDDKQIEVCVELNLQFGNLKSFSLSFSFAASD
jgi:hypothetical protein